MFIVSWSSSVSVYSPGAACLYVHWNCDFVSKLLISSWNSSVLIISWSNELFIFLCSRASLYSSGAVCVYIFIHSIQVCLFSYGAVVFILLEQRVLVFFWSSVC